MTLTASAALLMLATLSLYAVHRRRGGSDATAMLGTVTAACALSGALPAVASIASAIRRTRAGRRYPEPED